jgi:hypothetical protein
MTVLEMIGCSVFRSFQGFPPRYAGHKEGYLYWEMKHLARKEDTMHNIIRKAFDEWTTDVNPEDKRIRIFQHIRDIPFLLTGIIDPENGPVELLKQNRGSCSPKHFLLGAMYQKLNIPVKYASYPFMWSDLDVDYPGKLRKLADKLPVMPHLASKAYINGKWVLLDVTWDPSLKRVGFPVNEDWDGFSNTVNAVPPQEEIIHETIRERVEYLDSFESEPPYTEEQNRLIDEFCTELNNWVENVRKE